jgi:hypothetical protein
MLTLCALWVVEFGLSEGGAAVCRTMVKVVGNCA